MSFKSLALGAVLSTLTLPVFAEGSKIMIEGAYARSGAKTGAAFFTIMNHGDSADRLVGASSEVAPRVELHTHHQGDDGIAKMRKIEGGVAVAAGASHEFARGGDHVMFMGLPDALEDGSTISVTLTFENAGDVVVEIPVDNARRGKHAGHGDHSGHGS